MTNSHPHTNPPSKKELRYLRNLAISRGETFVYPRTSAESSAEIDRLLGRRRSSYADRAAERFAARQLTRLHGPATGVRDAEVEGYGGSARWKR
jgi:hypothetical protein